MSIKKSYEMSSPNNNNNNNRDQLDIITDILHVIIDLEQSKRYKFHNNQRFTISYSSRIMRDANVSSTGLKQYLALMLKNGLIEEQVVNPTRRNAANSPKSSIALSITSKGHEYLKVYRGLTADLIATTTPRTILPAAATK